MSSYNSPIRKLSRPHTRHAPMPFLARPGFMVTTPTHNIFHSMDGLTMAMATVPPYSVQLAPSRPYAAIPMDFVEPLIDDILVSPSPPPPAASIRRREPARRATPLREEWMGLKAKIDDDYPLYFTDLEEYGKQALILGIKYVEDLRDVLCVHGAEAESSGLWAS